MTYTIKYYGNPPLPAQSPTSIPVNTSGSEKEAILVAKHEVMDNKDWADRVEIYDAAENLVYAATKDELLSWTSP
jgi:hypothetical protein